MSGPTQLIVLGAGRPTNYADPLDAAGLPAHRSSLEWIRRAVDNHVVACHYVTGYRAAREAARTDGFTLNFNPDWASTGAVASLLCAPLAPGHQLLVCYADVVFREPLVQALTDDDRDIVLAIDSRWRARYTARSARDLTLAEKVRRDGDALRDIGAEITIEEADSEFVGLVKFSDNVRSILAAREGLDPALLRTGGLPMLISALVAIPGLSVGLHDAEGDWAELNAPQDLARFVFGTKAETLDRLQPLVRTVTIEDQARFTVADWATGPECVIAAVNEKFGREHVIVRSSAIAEDSWRHSLAGAFESVADVPADDHNALSAAIEAVIDSYATTNAITADAAQDQVLVQRMLRDVIASGVVLTRTLSHGSPYLAINYDPNPGRTDRVTAGGHDLRMLFVHHDAVALPADAPAWVTDMRAGVDELISLVGYDSLDLEFSIGRDGRIILMQLRPITVDHSQWVIDDRCLKAELASAVARFNAQQTPSGRLYGSRAVFGVMPDWNPAEIIGIRPPLLSISLYRLLICDEVWAQQRAEYGYKDVRTQPLLVSFAGHPYVNVRASVSSFIPANVPDAMADRLADHYMDRLVERPELHDKLEFDIAFTCLSLDFRRRVAAELRPAGFSDTEIETLRDGLAAVTTAGIDRYEGDLDSVDVLNRRFTRIMAAKSPPLERACHLLEECRRHGTPAFAHLARGAFVAMTILRSAVTVGLIDETFFNRYLESIKTVAKDFVQDCAELAEGRRARDAFLERYGFLRPRTYDIRSPTYAEQADTMLGQIIGPASGSDIAGAAVPPEWPAAARIGLERALSELGLEIGFERFERFARAVIEGREFSKFAFTRYLSQALTDLTEFGVDHDLDRATLSQIPVDAFFSLRAGEYFGAPHDFLRRTAEFFEERTAVMQQVELPPLIHDENQFFAFFYPPSQPNYVTAKSVTGPVQLLGEAGAEDARELRARIVVIDHADPGYDWLFGCGIAGLVTMYGGANSHMAIRAAEFSLPAAIGVGEVLFERLKHAETVLLDCTSRNISIIR